jgi:hypothetical protein
MCKRLICLVFAGMLGLAPAAFGDLVGWWKCDEGTGTIVHDSSGNGYDGTFEGNALWAAGMRDGAIDLNGGSGINCGDPAKLQIAGPMTVACWVKPSGLTGEQSLVARDASYVFKVHGTGLRLTTPGVLDHTSANTALEAATWNHVAATFVPGQAGGAVFYLNGVETSRVNASTLPAGTGPFRLGTNQWNERLTGQLDDVRVYTHVLTEKEIRAVMMDQTYPYATITAPADGAALASGQVTLEWKGGPFAVSHKVYLSDDAQAVAQGGAEALFATTADSRLQIGIPGSAYPTALALGKTYYWRVDEVNEANPQSPWPGTVSSFSTQPAVAWGATPADGLQYVNLNQDLSWQKGVGTLFHTVYFGDSFEAVDTATAGGLMTVDPKYDPGTLQPGAAYYWRVDEFTPAGTLKGDVWSFRTAPAVAAAGDPNLLASWTLDEGAGTDVVDWSGHGHSGTLAGGAQWTAGYGGAAGIAFNGANSYVNLGTPADLYLPRNYTYNIWFKVGKNIYGNSGPQYLMCIGSRSDLIIGIEDSVGTDGDLSLKYYDAAPSSTFHAVGVGQTVWNADEWHMVTATKDAAVGHKIYLDGELKNSDTNLKNDLYATTRMISLGARGWTPAGGVCFFNGVIDEVRIYNKALTADEIQQLAAGDPLVARDPSPARDAVLDIRDLVSLGWTAGDTAVSHDVYFGTSRNAVAAADKSAAEFQGNQTTTGFTPPGLVIPGGGDYFWRIDELAADGTVSPGTVWRFTVPNYVVIDDFESYTDNMDAGEAIYQTWVDGVDNNTGAYVGYPTSTGGTFGEIVVVHSGGQSMVLDYNNVNAPYYSETSRTWTTAQDWFSGGVDRLSLFVRGRLTNGPATLYVAVEDKAGHVAVVSYPDRTAVNTTWWQEWSVPLDNFSKAGVNLLTVKKLYLGVGSRTEPAQGGAGRIYLDDIRLLTH